MGDIQRARELAGLLERWAIENAPADVWSTAAALCKELEQGSPQPAPAAARDVCMFRPVCDSVCDYCAPEVGSPQQSDASAPKPHIHAGFKDPLDEDGGADGGKAD